ncbi:hypothetical protein PR048_025435 [Dryococelus australis]|uniref:Uncharacterized protein n=1 Tax=Dryococelus australis TaxID=614101 RepID=A0ABQ9GRE1_9NEOP|nr:hypothetical protein PR048_025435 [Dryococelus australis]
MPGCWSVSRTGFKPKIGAGLAQGAVVFWELVKGNHRHTRKMTMESPFPFSRVERSRQAPTSLRNVEKIKCPARRRLDDSVRDDSGGFKDGQRRVTRRRKDGTLSIEETPLVSEHSSFVDDGIFERERAVCELINDDVMPIISERVSDATERHSQNADNTVITLTEITQLFADFNLSLKKGLTNKMRGMIDKTLHSTLTGATQVNAIKGDLRRLEGQVEERIIQFREVTEGHLVIVQNKLDAVHSRVETLEHKLPTETELARSSLEGQMCGLENRISAVENKEPVASHTHTHTHQIHVFGIQIKMTGYASFGPLPLDPLLTAGTHEFSRVRQQVTNEVKFIALGVGCVDGAAIGGRWGAASHSCDVISTVAQGCQFVVHMFADLEACGAISFPVIVTFSSDTWRCGLVLSGDWPVLPSPLEKSPYLVEAEHEFVLGSDCNLERTSAFQLSTLQVDKQALMRVMRADEAEVRWVWSGARMQGWGKREIREKTRNQRHRPARFPRENIRVVDWDSAVVTSREAPHMQPAPSISVRNGQWARKGYPVSVRPPRARLSLLPESERWTESGHLVPSFRQIFGPLLMLPWVKQCPAVWCFLVQEGEKRDDNLPATLLAVFYERSRCQVGDGWLDQAPDCGLVDCLQPPNIIIMSNTDQQYGSCRTTEDVRFRTTEDVSHFGGQQGASSGAEGSLIVKETELAYLPKEFLLAYARHEVWCIYKHLPAYLQQDEDICNCLPSGPTQFPCKLRRVSSGYRERALPRR